MRSYISGGNEQKEKIRMKSLKRTMLVLCAFIMALGLAACTNGNNAYQKGTSTAAQ